MQALTQKYAIVCFQDTLPLGYEFSMDSWPPHVTVADVFAIDSKPSQLFEDLRKHLDRHAVLHAQTTSEEWFGEKKTIRVALIEKTKELFELHEEILNVLEGHGIVFNNPEYTHLGFLPHTSLKESDVFKKGVVMTFDSISFVDMFPDDNPSRRKILGTINFQKF